MNLYEELASTPDGRRELASSRLRERALAMLDDALEHSGMSQAELARVMGTRRHAVTQMFHGDGNLKLETFAKYLAAMGYEVDLELFAVGELRAAAMGDRAPVAVDGAPSRLKTAHTSFVSSAQSEDFEDTDRSGWDEFFSAPVTLRRIHA